MQGKRMGRGHRRRWAGASQHGASPGEEAATDGHSTAQAQRDGPRNPQPAGSGCRAQASVLAVPVAQCPWGHAAKAPQPNLCTAHLHASACLLVQGRMVALELLGTARGLGPAVGSGGAAATERRASQGAQYKPRRAKEQQAGRPDPVCFPGQPCSNFCRPAQQQRSAPPALQQGAELTSGPRRRLPRPPGGRPRRPPARRASRPARRARSLPVQCATPLWSPAGPVVRKQRGGIRRGLQTGGPRARIVDARPASCGQHRGRELGRHPIWQVSALLGARPCR